LRGGNETCRRDPCARAAHLPILMTSPLRKPSVTRAIAAMPTARRTCARLAGPQHLTTGPAALKTRYPLHRTRLSGSGTSLMVFAPGRAKTMDSARVTHPVSDGSTGPQHVDSES
jgi:hypothetical protein